ncbi:MAG: hypothetical protein Q8R22_05695 [Flavobacterium sp.]|uniref:Uncharacterized protein n=1 Tax=Flavobacterium algoritolerans TaxID=3041254 RepID=A0ABT6VFT3_9FLAO|nr:MULTISPECIES: hypothetical protein [Flavobacterium]MDI5896044.1 hypothetical protein [Flavobacterium algoritolerans]MDP3680310.1 hypothetical protein [Flavobacterium sp.]MDZ4331978.1 hypothetical protein [Flavobacterium sp.]PIF63144.1 hypothetical protein CLV00_2829 [Flavobacterium sp. 11]WKL44394.1 hypothetical protein Q1W72_01920 [Flavobacterium sp. ZE23DGlu08]
MKKIFFILIVLCNSVSYSQDIFDVIGKETCECLNAKKIDYFKMNKKEMQTQVGVCMIQSYSSHLSEFKPEDKISFDDEKGMQNLGEKVAMKMMVSCPEIIMEMGKRSIDEDDSIEEVKEIAFIEGEVTEIKTEQFITLQVKDKNGRNFSFLLLDYFETASLLTNNEINKKDSIKVSYTEIELFDPKNKEFRYFKVITDLAKK